MKFIHLSDLHIGKRFGERALTDDQDYILKQILRIIDEELPDGILIAGDIYDRAIPSAEAVQMLDVFLCALSERERPVFIISGNHDSPERLAFGEKLLKYRNIHISPVYDGNISPITMRDTYGDLNVYMLPFVKPSHVRRFYESEEIESYTDAIRVAISHMDVDTEKRNLLVTHQFVTGSSKSDSEEHSVGGTDNVDACVFEPFDYVALGHIHGPQNCGSERIRYCGTPLKYSFSEVNHQKSVTVVTLGEKGALEVRAVALVPKRDLHDIKGLYADITDRSFYENTTFSEDYVRVILTDEDEIPEAMNKLRKIYHNIISVHYDNTRTNTQTTIEEIEDAEKKSPLALFAEFYEGQNGRSMSEEQERFIVSLLDKIEEGMR